ncbi:hypothetical protein H2199_008985 [Coniosporium tulheliwenetii]|uniref:Uncharacterized protein n=1 Tax=Coniosporium tulheliwenetii TaxID=3383036 RepID=A0ACC2YH33_9PEZI|nr:hypothetical protein H2199_008985 [Cladosporium sp. JES 115]
MAGKGPVPQRRKRESDATDSGAPALNGLGPREYAIFLEYDRIESFNRCAFSYLLRKAGTTMRFFVLTTEDVDDPEVGVALRTQLADITPKDAVSSVIMDINLLALSIAFGDLEEYGIGWGLGAVFPTVAGLAGHHGELGQMMAQRPGWIKYSDSGVLQDLSLDEHAYLFQVLESEY